MANSRWAVKAGTIFTPAPSRAEAYKIRKNLITLGYLKPTVVDLSKIAG